MTTMTPRKLTPVRGRYHSHREEGGSVRERKSVHTSVLLDECVSALAPRKGEVVVDATYGRGGHSKALAAAANIKLYAIDADPEALQDASGQAVKGVLIGNFADLEELLAGREVHSINKILFDLGWNMTQLSAGRGFSFLHDEPLNMSYGPTPRSGYTAAEILNEWKEHVIADALFGYGDEQYARRIAKAIVERRKVKPFATTLELVEVVRDAVPAAYRRGKIHPVTKTFQALRMAVNDELRALEQGLRGAWRLLACNGRMAVITFHSIEDRAVKRLFAELVKEGAGELLYKKPLVPSATEITRNPSARSAKLRVITKVCTS
jgi:16S rRNA (cytosine1402-N4)-methyltransferase